MLNYQHFVRCFRECEESFNNTMLEALNIHNLGDKRLKHYKEIGLDTDDKVKQYEHKKSKELFDNVNISLGMAHIFEIDTLIKRYLILNKPPQTKEFYKRVTLPFKVMFLDVEMAKDDCDIGVERIMGMMVTETPIVMQKEDAKGIKFDKIGMGYRVHYLCEDQGKYFIDEFKIIIDKDTKIPIFYDDKATQKFLQEFVMNLLVFINDREIEIVERVRSQKNVDRREREGKMPLPSSSFIRLTGTLKKYMDSVDGSLGGHKYSYKFWVRGHFRYLKADRYKQKKGQWIKIEPFIKGEGILVKRVYRVTSTKEDERINELKKDNLFYDDIEPLKKPLREERG